MNGGIPWPSFDRVDRIDGDRDGDGDGWDGWALCHSWCNVHSKTCLICDWGCAQKERTLFCGENKNLNARAFFCELSIHHFFCFFFFTFSHSSPQITSHPITSSQCQSKNQRIRCGTGGQLSRMPRTTRIQPLQQPQPCHRQKPRPRRPRRPRLQQKQQRTRKGHHQQQTLARLSHKRHLSCAICCCRW